MAQPMTAEQWLDALRAEGVTDIVEMPGWRTHNRNHKGPFTDVHATMVHHTAGEGSGMPSYVYDGTGDLPGPLCHDYLTRSGRLYLVGNGRANHAGTVARNAYDAVLNESAVHPYPDAAEPIDGNAVSYGLEVENSGAVGRTWPAKQYDAAVRVQAARCRHHGWSADSVWAHREATRRKPVDPRLDMNAFRKLVAERLRHPASWTPGSTAPAPEPPQETDMPLTTDQDLKLTEVHARQRIAPWQYKGAGETLDAYAHLRSTSAAVKALTAQIAALSAVVTKLAESGGLTAAEAQAAAEAGANAALDRLADALTES